MSIPSPRMSDGELAATARDLRADIAHLVKVVDRLATRATFARRVNAGIIAILLAGVATNAYLWQTNRHINSYISCQSRYEETINERTRLLTEVAERERDATQAVMARIGELVVGRGDTPAQRQAKVAELDAAYKRWFEVIDQTAREREENPVPAPPSQTCG